MHFQCHLLQLMKTFKKLIKIVRETAYRQKTRYLEAGTAGSNPWRLRLRFTATPESIEVTVLKRMFHQKLFHHSKLAQEPRYQLMVIQYWLFFGLAIVWTGHEFELKIYNLMTGKYFDFTLAVCGHLVNVADMLEYVTKLINMRRGISSSEVSCTCVLKSNMRLTFGCFFYRSELCVNLSTMHGYLLHRVRMRGDSRRPRLIGQ